MMFHSVEGFSLSVVLDLGSWMNALKSCGA